MTKEELFRAVFSTDSRIINSAIAEAGQINLDASDGKSRICISFFDIPVRVGYETSHICAWAIMIDQYGNHEYTALCRSTPTANNYIILKSSVPHEGSDSDYKMFSYAAMAYAHENNWEFPATLPYRLLHPDFRR